jgi:hypothetical protein
MITPYVFLGGYGALGVAAGVFVLLSRRGVARQGPALTAVLCLPLWPFVLPLLLSPAAPPPPPRSRHQRAIDGQARRLEAALLANPAPLGLRDARDSLHAFIDGLKQQQRRLDELDDAIDTSPAAAREALAAMRERARQRLDEGAALLDALIAELTLLRFSDLREDAAEGREQVEDLLTRMRALGALEAGEV